MTKDTAEQQHLLEKLMLSEELEELNGLTGDFNIFNALKLHNNETRHSNFLGWLLAPYESHGLGDYFLKEFLKTALREHSSNEKVDASLSDVAFHSFEDAEIRREWKNIDVLIINPVNKFLCVIENKIWSGEHSNQLERYKKIVEGKFKDYKRIFVFLIPTSDNEPLKERDGAFYIQMDYEDISGAIEKTLRFKAKSMSKDVRIFIEHYKKMIERNIMGTTDATIVELCRKIYREHKEAIKLINENSSVRAEMSQFVYDFIKNNEDLIEKDIKDSPTKLMRFLPKIDNLGDNLRWGDDGNWTNGNIIALEFNMNKDGAILAICIQQAQVGRENERDKLIDFIEKKLDITIKNRQWIAENLICFDDFYDAEEAQKHIEARITEIGWIDKLREALEEYLK